MSHTSAPAPTGISEPKTTETIDERAIRLYRNLRGRRSRRELSVIRKAHELFLFNNCNVYIHVEHLDDVGGSWIYNSNDRDQPGKGFPCSWEQIATTYPRPQVNTPHSPNKLLRKALPSVRDDDPKDDPAVPGPVVSGPVNPWPVNPGTGADDKVTRPQTFEATAKNSEGIQSALRLQIVGREALIAGGQAQAELSHTDASAHALKHTGKAGGEAQPSLPLASRQEGRSSSPRNTTKCLHTPPSRIPRPSSRKLHASSAGAGHMSSVESSPGTSLCRGRPSPSPLPISYRVRLREPT